MLFSAKELIAVSGMSRTAFFRKLNFAIFKKEFEKKSPGKKYDTYDAMQIAKVLSFSDRFDKYYEMQITQVGLINSKSPKVSQSVPNSPKVSH